MPSGRRTSLRGPTCTQTFNLVQPGPAGRQGPLGKEEGREGGGHHLTAPSLDSPILLLYVPSHCNATQVVKAAK